MWATDILLRGRIGFRQRSSHVHPRRWIQYLNPLTDTEKVHTRRYCGYPAYGSTAAGFSSWRFYQTFGLLEYRIGNLADGEINVVRKYLGTLADLENAIPAASSNLDTNQAAVWSMTENECQDRERLYDGWRVRFCAFLGVPPGPGLCASCPNLIV